MTPFRKFREGFSLVEVVVALSIASFCLVTLLALMPVGIQHNQQAEDQSVMVNLATMVARDLEATPDSPSPAPSPRFQFSIPPSGSGSAGALQTIYVDPEGNATGAIGSSPTTNSRYRITLTFFPPATGTPTLKNSTVVRILITWPAQADPNPSQAPIKYSNSFQTSISLNRN